MNNRLYSAVAALFPTDADTNLLETTMSGTTITIKGKLANDPARPNKPSKTIAVHLTQDLVEDFVDGDADMQKRGLEKLSRLLQDKLRAFNPNHDTPYGLEPPVETWTISSVDIFM